MEIDPSSQWLREAAGLDVKGPAGVLNRLVFAAQSACFLHVNENEGDTGSTGSTSKYLQYFAQNYPAFQETDWRKLLPALDLNVADRGS